MIFENKDGDNESWKTGKDDKSENLDAESITQVDLTKAWFFITEYFARILHVTGTQVDQHLVDLVLKHIKRVADMAQYIGKQAGLDSDLIRFEALCHDFQKLNPQKPGGLSDLMDHATLATGPFAKFMTGDLKKTPAFTARICGDMFEHISTPVIVGIVVRDRRALGSFYGYVLRCANMLDYAGASGLIYDVELRQRKYSLGWKEDGGDFKKAFASACRKRDLFLKDLFENCPLFKTLWRGFDEQFYRAREAIIHLASINKTHSEKFIKIVELSKPKNIIEFRKLYKVFQEQQLQHV